MKEHSRPPFSLQGHRRHRTLDMKRFDSGGDGGGDRGDSPTMIVLSVNPWPLVSIDGIVPDLVRVIEAMMLTEEDMC